MPSEQTGVKRVRRSIRRPGTLPRVQPRCGGVCGRGPWPPGLEAALRERPAVVILDLMLPDIPGTEVCRRLRVEHKLEDVGILMLTARGDEYDRVLGFEVGADDYVVKPSSVRELVLRVRTLARRSSERFAARRASDAESAPSLRSRAQGGLHAIR